MCVEFGGHASCNPAYLRIVEEGLQRVLQALGMLRDDVPSTACTSRFVRVDGAQHYVFAPHSGVFEPAFSGGDEVKAGQLAGRLFDPQTPWAPPKEVRFSGDGIAICVRSFAGVEAGDCIALLASDTKWQ